MSSKARLVITAVVVEKRRWWEDGYNGRDLPLIDVLFAATYIHHSNDNVLDRATFREAAAAFQHSFPDSSVRIKQLIGEGDLVVARWRFSGTIPSTAPVGVRHWASSESSFDLGVPRAGRNDQGRTGRPGTCKGWSSALAKWSSIGDR